MQRKALKQLGKVTQWTNEKVFSGEKTQLSSEFTDFERDIDVKRKGIERLHATSQPFFQQLTKVKTTADPYPPAGSGKDKIHYTEALGLVMIDYGGDMKNAYGGGLAKYGRARCKLALAQEVFGNRLRDGYIAGMESSLETVNEYKTFRKKLDSRRLALDAAIGKLNGAKKDHDKLEFEVQNARERFEEVEEETAARMEMIQAGEESEFEALTDLLEAELAYYSHCQEVLQELKESWPTGGVTPSMGRPRSGTTASSRSIKQPRRSVPASSDDEEATPNRSRSHSNASASGRVKERRSILPSFGSFGKKGAGLSGIASMGNAKRREKEQRRGFGEDERAALNSDEDDDGYAPQLSPRSAFASSGRTRSTSTLSTIHHPIAEEESSYSAAPPVLKRTYTSPAHPGAKFVKALYDFAGESHDELSLRPGMVVEVKQEVSADWWIGESGGRSGMFPSSYTEEYVPTPQTAVPPPMPRRNMPPSGSGTSGELEGIVSRSTPPRRSNYLPPSPTLDYHLTSDSELSHGYDDADHYTTASLATGGQPAAQGRTLAAPPMAPSSSFSGKKAPPPPPPASRRSQSSTNVLSLGNAPPPPPPSRSRAGTITRQSKTESSPEGSPFGGPSPFANSEDDESDAPSLSSSRSGRGMSSPPVAASRGLSSGLGAMHLHQNGQDNGTAAASQTCGVCDCHDFTQNVFKPKGTCSTCFHQH